MKAQVNFSGWQAVVALVAVIIFVIIRITSMSDQLDNKPLMEKLQRELNGRHFSAQMQQIQMSLAAGDADVADQARKLAAGGVQILEVTTSAPLLGFSSNERVVVKVGYFITMGPRKDDYVTEYFWFTHAALGNRWHLERRATPFSYYLNFM
ncbi:hypothetical protein HBA55_10065 [Pseudomaricurvus alkylphenolicus]|uniref:hypothetical protein n=1 Tax=Pseudomaricurvus alkylphenolicus TaxID=1306991 RepID=UPI00142000DF|nr:hypothetical protein [Pseudomaricurvus alkylphenolicus]NIB39932.1 hypothetical protein [Pseudomaricurvus alkylphenolicus]